MNRILGAPFFLFCFAMVACQNADSQTTSRQTGKILVEIPEPLQNHENVSLGQNRSVLLADSFLALLPSGKVVEIGFIPTYLRFDEASSRIIAGNFEEIVVLTLSEGRDQVSEIEKYRGFFGRVLDGKLTVSVATKSATQQTETMYESWPLSGFIEDRIVTVGSASAIALRRLPSGMESVRWTRSLWTGSALETVGLVYDNEIASSGSELVDVNHDLSWFLAATAASGKSLATLYKLSKGKLERFVPRLLDREGLSVYCLELWVVQGVVGALFYTFDVMTEERRKFLSLSIDEEEVIEIDEKYDVVWPCNGKWLAVTPRDGRWVVSLVDLSSITNSKDD